MNDTQTLELQLKTVVESAISKVDQLTNSISNMSSGITKAKDNISGFSKAFAFGGTYLGIKKLTSKFLEWQKLSIDFTEQLNLFNVVFKNVEKDGVQTFSKLGQEATKFQNKLNEAFGTNKTETLRYQALFESMGENVGIPAEYAKTMSETMTKFTYDLASLYNKDEATTGEALRAGVYAGQTKPLRSFGIDVTQTSLQPILDQLGIDRTVKDLSQAEKEIVRYIATLKQGQIAMGDFANTINSPANQLKIFKQQLVETKVALTSLFINAFAQILPYANAILMVIKEISKAIASFFGIKLQDYNTGIASVGGAFDDVGSSVGDATGKVKELKREILSFDQIHNINENNNSGGSGSSGGASGGIDQRLLDAINGYDNGMDKVRNKATEIRDKIMEWLGFTKHTNKETGETYFTYGGIGKTLSNIVKWWKELNLQGKIWASLGIALVFVNLYRVLKKIAGITGITKLFSILSTGLGGLKTLIPQVSTGFTSLASALGLSTGALALIAAAVVAVVAIIVGSFVKAYSSSEEFRNKVSNAFNAIKDLFYELYEKIKEVTDKIKEVLEPAWNIIKTNVGTAVKMLYETIVLNFNLILDKITGVCNIIVDLMNGDFKKAFKDAGDMAKNLHADWSNWFEKIKELYKDWAKKVIEQSIEFVKKCVEKLSDLITWIKELPNKFFYYAGLAVGTLWKVITETDWIELGKKVLTGIVNGIKNIGSSLWDFGTKIYNHLRDAIRNINFSSIGESILDGIKNGLFNFGGKLRGWGSSFVSGLKDALGIHSPSKLVIKANVGDYITDAIVIGMENEIPKLRKTAVAMTNELNDIFSSNNYDGSFEPELEKNNNIFNNMSTCIDYYSIQKASYEGFVQAINQYGLVNVNITAKTDKGTIVETAVNGINEQTRQTGVCPINI